MMDNYFSFYGLEPSFLLDRKELKRLFIAKSRQLHPDFHMENADAVDDMTMQSSSNNKAYEVLKNEFSRWRYIVDMFSEKEFSKELDPMFLMEMMEYNESIMELEFDFDEGKKEEIALSVDTIEKQMYDEILSSIEGSEKDVKNQELLQKVHQYLLKRNYLLRIQENLDKFASR